MESDDLAIDVSIQRDFCQMPLTWVRPVMNFYLSKLILGVI